MPGILHRRKELFHGTLKVPIPLLGLGAKCTVVVLVVASTCMLTGTLALLPNLHIAWLPFLRKYLDQLVRRIRPISALLAER